MQAAIDKKNKALTDKVKANFIQGLANLKKDLQNRITDSTSGNSDSKTSKSAAHMWELINRVHNAAVYAVNLYQPKWKKEDPNAAYYAKYDQARQSKLNEPTEEWVPPEWFPSDVS